MHLEPGNVSVRLKFSDTSVAYTVAKERGTPTSDYAAQTLSCTNLTVCLHVALVEFWINLTATFDQVQGCNRRVGKTLCISRLGIPLKAIAIYAYRITDTSKKSTKGTGGIVLGCPKFNLAGLILRSLTSGLIFMDRCLLHLVDDTPCGEGLTSGGSIPGLLRLRLVMVSQSTQRMMSSQEFYDRVRGNHGDLFTVKY